MIAYDLRYNPPAPVSQATVGSVTHSRHRRTLPGLLDTGSDITAVPGSLVDTLQLYPVGRLKLENIQSETEIVFTYAVQLSIADLSIPRLEVVLTGLDLVIVGRDVLNQLYVRFDGPDRIFSLSSEKLSW